MLTFTLVDIPGPLFISTQSNKMNGQGFVFVLLYVAIQTLALVIDVSFCCHMN